MASSDHSEDGDSTTLAGGSSLTRYTYMVLVTPKAGREADWCDWHGSRHVLDMLDVPGILSCRRFEAAPWQSGKDGPRWRFMALYEIETTDLPSVFLEVRRRFGSELMPKTDASDPANTVSVAWTKLSEHSA